MTLGPLVAIYAIWTLFGLSWLAAAMWHGGSVVRAPKRDYRLQLLIAMLGYVGMFIEAPATRGLWRLPPWTGWVMVALALAGVALAWWARIVLGKLWSGGIIRREGHRIVDTGPYAWVRHPIYTGLFLGSVALAAVKATPLSLVGAALIIIGFALKARIEERFLAAELGEADYAAYRRRVGMLLPRL